MQCCTKTEGCQDDELTENLKRVFNGLAGRDGVSQELVVYLDRVQDYNSRKPCKGGPGFCLFMEGKTYHSQWTDTNAVVGMASVIDARAAH